MPDRFTYDVFLSHNSKDKPRVRKLAEDLRAAGLRVWFDEWVVKPGDDIYLAIERGLEAARSQVLCLSPAALGSDWVALERSTVIFRDPTNAGRRFIPLLLADCELPDALRRYKHVDYRLEVKAVFEELVAACRSAIETEPSTVTVEPLTTSAKLKQAKRLAVLERKLTGHEQWVRSIAISPDSKWAASGSGSTDELDCSVRIWNLATGESIEILEGHTHWVWSVSFTQNGNYLLSGSINESIAWNVNDRHPIRMWKGDGSHVLSLRNTSLALPGRPTILRSSDREVELCDLVSGKLLKKFTGHSRVQCLAASSDGRRFASGAQDGTVILWDVETGRVVATFAVSKEWVLSVDITSDDRYLVTGSQDRTIKIWDLETNACLGTLEGHGSEVRACSSPDGAIVASTGGLDRTLRLWDLQSGTPLQVIEFADIYIGTAVFSPDGKRILVSDSSGTIYVYALADTQYTANAEPTSCYVNAKVVLIGEGTVGKTSLAHRLIEDRYVIRDRTHGMNVWPLELPLPHDATLEREALLWDLAGQEDYRLIHQFFLDETALALLLINPQKDDPFAEAGDWLKALETAESHHPLERRVPRLLIFSQIDVGGIKIGKAKIEGFLKQHGFAGWLATSAKTGEKCSDTENGSKPSDLKQMIADHIPWSTLPWTATPRLLAELKTAVTTIRDETDIRLLRFSELAQRLEQALPGERFGESDVRTAVILLANHGLIRPLKFGDLVLLRPDLLSGYAGAIIRAARAHLDEIGCVLEADIYDPSFDFTGVDRLSRPDEELLLRAMVQIFLNHSLCIAEDTPQGRHLVFPSQYRREKDIPWEPDVFISYTFSPKFFSVASRNYQKKRDLLSGAGPACCLQRRRQ